ncbi:hypothetical protein SALBM217S_07371 [Streptomyces griseoloalbus]
MSDRKRAGTRPTELLCGSCGQPVETVVTRHKTLGVNVPPLAGGPLPQPRLPRLRPRMVRRTPCAPGPRSR